MATVYLAEDLKHHRQVALKLLRPELAAPLFSDRFLREVRITARLNHPHILPLLDSGEADGFVYYTMPYVEGESLRGRLEREQQLPLDDAIQIAREVADALSYAHSHDFVHRDIKPENILLQSGHAVVADFGIARAITAAGGDRLTATGLAVGTPAYMSPEQASGSTQLDGRSDVYSLGCVLYEMLAGEPPYTGSSAQAVIAKRLSEPVPHLRTLRDVPQAIEQVVTKALARVPADRFATAGQFALALKVPSVATGRAERHWIRTALLGSGVAILIAAGSVLALMPRSKLALVRTLLTRPAARLDARRVVVAPFDNETGDSNLASLGEMAADWITRGLSRTGVVEVVDGRTALLTSRIVEQTPRIFRTRNRARALAEETGAGTVVWGNYYRDGDSLRFEAQVTDVASGRVIRTVEPANGRLASPAEVIDRLRQRVVASLAVIADTANSGWASPDEPPSYEAYQETVRGVSAYFRSDTADAFRHLRRAVALDSTYVTPVIVLAYTHDIYRQWDQVDSLVRRAERYRARFVPAEQAWLDLLNADLRGDLSASLRAAQELLRLSPGSAEYAVLVALTAVYQNRPPEALTALSRLDPHRGALLGPAGPWYWVHLTNARHEHGSYGPELEDARRGMRQFPEALLVAYCELRALAAVGRLNDLETRRRAFASSARPDLLNRVELLVAGEVRAHGYRTQAIQLADHLVSRLRSTGVDTLAPKSAGDRTAGQVVLARALYLAEHWGEAQTVYTALARQDSSSATYQGALGAIAARQGNRSEAERIARRLANVRGPHLFGINTYDRARIAALLGEREKAVTLLRDALAQGLRGWSFLGDADIHTEVDFESLHNDPPFLDLVQPRR